MKKEQSKLGGEILPSSCNQVTSNIYSIEGVAVEELESMLRSNYAVPKNSGHVERPLCMCVCVYACLCVCVKYVGMCCV